MPPPIPSENRTIPLCVDLDGTLIKTDMLWESVALLLKRNPFAVVWLLLWWTRGRAFLKKQLAARVTVNPATLPVNEAFLAWLRAEKKTGRKIILATASDLKMAKPVADHFELFDEVLASDGKTNLRSQNKVRVLTEKFGERGFDYAGNSTADYAVWRGSRRAVVVNASPRVLEEAARCTELGPTFCDGYSPSFIAKRVGAELLLRSGYPIAVGAGLLLASAFPKWSLAGFAWIAPALMLAATRGKSGAESFRLGYASGLVFWLMSLYWLLLMPATGFPILAWLALAAYIAVYQGAWVWLISNFEFRTSNWGTRLFWSLGGAAAWVALEMIRARLFSGFPWSFLGASQYQLTPLLQIAAFTGVYGVSFLIVWFSLALYSTALVILRQPTKRYVWQAEIVLPLVVVVAGYVGGYFAMRRSIPADKFLRVTAVQPSVPQTLIWSSDEDARRFQSLLDMSRRALTNQTDLLVWPESAVPPIDEPTYQAINHFVESNHVWLLLNGDDSTVTPSATNYFNAAFLVGPDGRWRLPAYHKRQLVIFGEYVPLVNWLPFLKWLTPITGGWTSGEKPMAFDLDYGVRRHVGALESGFMSSHSKISPLICFEDTFPGAARESAQEDVDLLVNLTNDGWFQESAEQRQHLANAVFRAVENGLPLLRSANNGVTCLIDPHGRIEKLFRDARGSEYGPGAFTVEIPLLSPAEKPAPTFYNQHGDWFGWGCVGIASIMIIRKFLARKS